MVDGRDMSPPQKMHVCLENHPKWFCLMFELYYKIKSYQFYESIFWHFVPNEWNALDDVRPHMFSYPFLELPELPSDPGNLWTRNAALHESAAAMHTNLDHSNRAHL